MSGDHQVPLATEGPPNDDIGEERSEGSSVTVAVPIDRSQDVTIEQGIARTQHVQDVLRGKANAADKDIMRFQTSHSLSNNRAIWAAQYCKRLRFEHKKYRGKIKQELVDEAKELQTLHTEWETGLNPYKHITALAHLAWKHCHIAYRYYEQVQQFYDTHTQDGTMVVQKRYLTERALTRAQATIQQLHRDEEAVDTTYTQWKPCIALLSAPQRHLRKGLAEFRARKLYKYDFEEDCNSAFRELAEIVAMRNKVRDKINTLDTLQAVVWFSIRDRTVSPQFMARALGRYDGLDEEIAGTHDAQRRVLQKLQDMYERAKTTPDTLPGLDGRELPVQRLLATVAEYEKLAGLCNETYALAKSTSDDLRSVLSVT